MHPIRVLTVAALIAITASVPALAQEHPGATEHPQATEHPKATEHPEASKKSADGNDLVTVARHADGFETLVAAIEAAGLVNVLQGEGPFTVFAPTDAAFASLPDGTVENLLKPQNKARLTSILTYHVIEGKVMAADVKSMKAGTVQGQDLSIEVKDGTVMVGDAKVIETDIIASNGVIHVIDGVLMPRPADQAKPRDHPGH